VAVASSFALLHWAMSPAAMRMGLVGGEPVTVTVALSRFPRAVAVIVVEPGIPPVTRPEEDTMATAGSSVAHANVTPLACASSVSSAWAVSWAVPPL
jgi:hypothetical protein